MKIKDIKPGMLFTLKPGIFSTKFSHISAGSATNPVISNVFLQTGDCLLVLKEPYCKPGAVLKTAVIDVLLPGGLRSDGVRCEWFLQIADPV